jgi:hypothetical protein
MPLLFVVNAILILLLWRRFVRGDVVFD